MNLQINAEYFYKAGLFTSTNKLRSVLQHVCIYDSEGKRFYVGGDGYGVIELQEPIKGDALPVKELLLRTPKSIGARIAKKAGHLNLTAASPEIDFGKVLTDPNVFDGINYHKLDACLKWNEKEFPATIYKGNYFSYKNVMPIKDIGYDAAEINRLNSPFKKLITEKLGIPLDALRLFDRHPHQVCVMYTSENMRFSYRTLKEHLWQQYYGKNAKK